MRSTGKSKHRTPNNKLFGASLISEDRYRTFADCISLLIRNPKEVRNIPSAYLGYRLFTATAERNPQIISYIPAQYVDIKLCKGLVEANKKSLSLLNPAFRTEEILLLHIQTHKNGINDLKENERTYKMYLEAVKKDKSSIMIVPDELKSAEMCYEALSDGYGMNLVFIPIEAQNLDICIHALKNGCPPSYIPKTIAQTEAFKQEIQKVQLEMQATKRAKTKKSRKIAIIGSPEIVDKPNNCDIMKVILGENND